jgi:hypothetical protein
VSELAESTLTRLIGIFDVAPSQSEPGRFTGRTTRRHRDAGTGRTHVRQRYRHGQPGRPDLRDLLTQEGRIIASFTQDAMIRGFDPRRPEGGDSRRIQALTTGQVP